MKEEWTRDGNTVRRIVRADVFLLPRYQWELLKADCPKGVLLPSVCELDGEVRCVYELGNRKCLAELAKSEKIGFALLCDLVLSVCRLTGELEEHLVEAGRLSLTGRDVFVDLESREILFCLHPFRESEDFVVQMKNAAGKVLACIDHKDADAVALAYDLYAEIDAGDFSLDRLVQLTKRKQSTVSLSREQGKTEAPACSPEEEKEAVPVLPERTEPPAEEEPCDPDEILWSPGLEKTRREENGAANGLLKKLKQAFGGAEPKKKEEDLSAIPLTFALKAGENLRLEVMIRVVREDD